jgi:hypothetical protein
MADDPDPQPELRPHPLVSHVAGKLRKELAFKDALSSLVGKGNEDDADDRQLADALARQTDPLDLVCLVGFLGGTVDDKPRGTWRVLYLDVKLRTWLIVRPADILCYHRLKDDNVPYKKRDAIWVKGDAPLTRGELRVNAKDIEARFLSGQFTRAQDLGVSVRGGTFTASTGIFCDATTPYCCTRPAGGNPP